ncbi:MAG: hypothetical protein WC783_03400 [Candidatus Paceibacterota bacterium]|jgi:hypothetical protein
MKNISPNCPFNGRCIMLISTSGEVKFGLSDFDCHEEFCELTDCPDINEIELKLKGISCEN